MSREPALGLKSRLQDMRKRHHRVLNEYRELKARVDEYTGRRYLPPGEEMERKTLQRIKLFKKDALHALQRDIDSLEQKLSGSRS